VYAERRSHIGWDKVHASVCLQGIAVAAEQTSDWTRNASPAVAIHDCQALPVEIGVALSAEDGVEHNSVHGTDGEEQDRQEMDNGSFIARQATHMGLEPLIRS
jgi:hypothetical protein